MAMPNKKQTELRLVANNARRARSLDLDTGRHIKYPARPRTFTSNEKFIEALAEEIITSEYNYKSLAHKCGLAYSTVQRIGSRQTKWPRYTTLFPLVDALGYRLAMVPK